MPKNPDPLPVNLEHWNDNLFKTAYKRRSIDLMIQIGAVEDALSKREISDFAAVMEALKYFDSARTDKTFIDAEWKKYLSRFRGGTVEIPADWIKVMMEVWAIYTDSVDPKPFEKAAGMSGVKNRRKANTKIVELTEKFYLALMVAQHKFDALGDGKALSDEDAIYEVHVDLAAFEGAERSEATIKSAWARWGQFIERDLELRSAKVPGSVL